MNTNFVYAGEEATVKDAIEQVRLMAEDIDHVYHIYILKASEELIGFVPIKYLLIHPLDTKLKNILSEDLITVTPEVDQEEEPT